MSASNGIRHVPVAIVGGGPVGLMLAMFLDRHGVRSVVFNTERTVRIHPKGSTHNSRTMEHYRRLGFADRIRGLGLPPDHPTDVSYFTSFNGHELARIALPSEQEKLRARAYSDRLDQILEPIHRANQMYVEPTLFDEAQRRPNIELRFGWRVDGFDEGTAHISLACVHQESGRREEWHAAYLVGCDGGRSSIRQKLGIRYEGFENLKQAFFGGKMVSTYLRAPTLYRDFLGGKRSWQYWIVNPHLRTAMVPLNGVDEFLLWTRDDDEDNPPSPDTIRQVLRMCAGTDVPFEILAHGKWTAGVALVAERFVAGERIALAGDAVHLFTPTGGFGMNTGVDDAANLAWKLAALVQGWGGASLLASYEAERKPIAVRNTKAARMLAKSVGSVPVPPELADDSDAGARARAATGAFLSTFGEEYASLGVQLGARYDGSPIIVSDMPPPAEDLFNYVPSSIPGGRAPHAWLGESRGAGNSLFDQLGIGFTLLCLSAGPTDTSAIEEAAAQCGMPLKVLRLDDQRISAMYGVKFALIRPDQHVAWRGEVLPADLEHLLSTVCGLYPTAASTNSEQGLPWSPDDVPLQHGRVGAIS